MQETSVLPLPSGLNRQPLRQEASELPLPPGFEPPTSDAGDECVTTSSGVWTTDLWGRRRVSYHSLRGLNRWPLWGEASELPLPPGFEPPSSEAAGEWVTIPSGGLNRRPLRQETSDLPFPPGFEPPSSVAGGECVTIPSGVLNRRPLRQETSVLPLRHHGPISVIHTIRKGSLQGFCNFSSWAIWPLTSYSKKFWTIPLPAKVLHINTSTKEKGSRQNLNYFCHHLDFPFRYAGKSTSDKK